MVLIAGGGPAADVVRVLDRIHGLGDETAHRLALHAMDLTAIILAELLPGTVLRRSTSMAFARLVGRRDPGAGSALSRRNRALRTRRCPLRAGT